MASTIPSEEEILLCCICLETLEEPKILGCLHRFCKKCLAKVIEEVPDGGDTFQCPTCRHDERLPENGLAGISNDFLLHGILENRKLELDIRSEKKDQTCGSCKRFTTVMAICPHCRGFICETCHTGHTLMTIFEDHNHMVTLKEIETGEVSFDIQQMKSVGNPPKCPNHKDMTLHINCRTCEQLICPVCAPLHHQNHEFEEIHIAAKRVKEKIGALVEESEENERVLEKSVDEIKEIRSRYEVEIDRIRGMVRTIAHILEEDVQAKKQSDLEELEQKRQSIEQKASENMLAISRERTFVEDEIQMVASFVQHSLDQVETEKLDTIRKVKDCQTTTGILTNSVDDWSLLKAAPDIQKVLDVEQEETNIQHLRETSVNLGEFSKSPLNNQCWKKWQPEGAIQVMKYLEDSGYSNMKIFNILRTQLQGTLSISAAGDGEESRYSASRRRTMSYSVKQSVIAMMSLNEKRFLVNVNISATHENIFHVWVFADFVLSVCNTANSSSIYHGDKYIKDVDTPGKVSCCTYFPQPPNEGVLLGVENSTMLYKCDVNGNLLSEIPVKEDGLKPPVSMCVPNADLILLCDGESKALAIGVDGEVIARFASKCPTDNPMLIASDADKFVYVLWDTVAGAQQLRNIRTGAVPRDKSHMTDGNDDGDDLKVVQYSTKGVYISEVYVNWRIDLMTTTTVNNGEVIVLASNDGIFQCFEMTPFGKKFSKFVRDRDIQNAANSEE